MDLTGRTALITGASSGIGAVFADQLAARGTTVILAARRRDALETLAGRLRCAHGAEAMVEPVDLSLADGVERLSAIDCDVLVNCAGFGVYGDVATADASRLRDQVLVNVLALQELTRAHLPRMVDRDWGVILNMSSAGSFLPLPHMASYGASKAFVQSFTEAVWKETQHTNVRVLSLVPGPTDTPFHAATGSSSGSFGKFLSPEQVVATALRALDGQAPSAIVPRTNNLLSRLLGLLPRGAILAIGERTMR